MWMYNAEAFSEDYEDMMDELNYINEMDAMEAEAPTDEVMDAMASLYER